MSSRMNRVMPHLVAGYPNLSTSVEIIRAFDNAGAGYIEVQIPFSDPIADGTVISDANRIALENGTTTSAVFGMIREISSETEADIVIMTYGNIIYSMGFETFIRRAADAGVSGVILPDLPFDEQISPPLDLLDQYGVSYIPVVSPGISDIRLEMMCGLAKDLIYTTLRKGITGTSGSINAEGLNIIERIRSISTKPVAAGFGISSTDHVTSILNHADYAVVGSHLIQRYNRGGIRSVVDFLEAVNRQEHVS